VTGKRRVLLLHGLWMAGAAMRRLAARLAADGFAPEIVAYASVSQTPELAVERLQARLRDGGADIVAHSLGGLIALQTLRTHPALHVGRVVCLGSPLRGAAAASGLQRLPGGATLLGRCAPLLCAGIEPWPQMPEVGVIAGRTPLGLGRFIGRFDGPSDGTVAVAETRIDGLADHVVIDASHTGLILAPRAAQLAAAFLRDGRFPTP
jgi:pimeloyl-ACP methyl ester carboxylesterase